MGFITKPVGSLVGDVVGGVAGGIAEGTGATTDFNATPIELQQSDYQQLIQQGQQAALNNQAAQQTAAQQGSLADALRAQMMGGGPANDLAQAQLQAATARNQQMAAAQAASQKGLNPALAARLAGQNQAMAQQQAANQAAQLKAQTSLGAQGQLANALSSQRQADIAQQRTNLEALQSAGQLQNQQNQARIQNQLGAQDINARIATENAKTRAGIAGGLMQGGASAAAASDERLKTDVKHFDSEKFLDALKSYQYKYKDPKSFGEGKQVGVMAQDLEKTAPQMVIDTPRGKVIDYNKAGGPMLASLAELNDRVKELEGKKPESPKKMADGGMVGNLNNEVTMMPRYNSIFADQLLQQNQGPSLGVDTTLNSNAGQMSQDVNAAADPSKLGAALGAFGQKFGSSMQGISANGGYTSTPYLRMADGGIVGDILKLGLETNTALNPPITQMITGKSTFDLGKQLLNKAHGGAIDFRTGGHVPGQPKVKGDHEVNDVVPAMLSPGEIVLPRSVALAPDAAERAKQFVMAIKDKEEAVEKKSKGGPVGYAKVLAKHRELEQRMAKLEKSVTKKVK